MAPSRRFVAGACPGPVLALFASLAFAATSVKLHDPPISIPPERPKPPSVVVIHAGSLIDGKGGAPLANAQILIRDGRVAQVGSRVDAPPEAMVMDLSAYTVLPGFIDCHTHLTHILDKDWEVHWVRETPADEAIRGVAAARATLEAGFTTVRNVGASGFSDVALKNAIEKGIVPGPRMVCATQALSIIGGHGDVNGFAPGIREDEPGWKHGVIAGPENCRAAVRYAVKHGAEVIKIMSTGGVLSTGDAVTARQFSDEELRLIMDEATLAGRKVCSHAHGAEGIKAAVRAGVASIEHGTFVDEEGLRLMKEKGCYLVPTRLAGETVLERAESGGLPPAIADKARQVAPIMRDGFARAVKAGVKIAFGTDSGVYPHGLNGREFRLLVEGGMTPMAAILAATRNAADLLGRKDVGVLEAGRWGDLVAVEGDPLADVSRLERPVVVLKGGEVFLDRRK